MNTETQNHVNKLNTERIKSYDDQLIVSAKHGALGQVVHQLWQREVGWYKGDTGAARLAIKERLLYLARTKQIDPGQLAQLTDFKFLHKGTGKEEDITYFKEFATWGTEIAQLQEEIHQAEQLERKNEIQAHVKEILAGEEEYGMFTNADKQAIIQGLRDKFPNFRDSEIPDELKNLLTVEGKADQEYIDILEMKRDLNQPIHANDW